LKNSQTYQLSFPTNGHFQFTDGQIFLKLIYLVRVIRPAINAGLSVSRVGGAAQTKVVKKLGGGVRLATQYRVSSLRSVCLSLRETTSSERGQK
jgi:F0F1-type ATP synthase alpha subunit